MEELRRASYTLFDSYKRSSDKDDINHSVRHHSRYIVDLTEDNYTRNRENEKYPKPNGTKKIEPSSGIHQHSIVNENRFEIEEKLYHKGIKINQLV